MGHGDAMVIMSYGHRAAAILSLDLCSLCLQELWLGSKLKMIHVQTHGKILYLFYSSQSSFPSPHRKTHKAGCRDILHSMLSS